MSLARAALLFTLWFALMCVPAVLVWLHDRHTRAGGDMPHHSRPSIRDRVRAWLGTDRLSRMEKLVTDALTELTDLKADLASYTDDVSAKLDQLLAAQGELNPQAQAVFDDLKAAVAEAHAKVGDADGSDTPPAEQV